MRKQYKYTMIIYSIGGRELQVVHFTNKAHLMEEFNSRIENGYQVKVMKFSVWACKDIGGEA